MKKIKDLSMVTLFELAGYDYSKFDSACPQSFFDAKLKLGIKDHYGWYYGDENSHILGRPMSLLEVLNKLAADGKLCVIDDKEIAKS